ncbi:MAG: MEDS domain-containing protein [Candidatus Desulforudis sp.]|nr:MEDS domain-containing protein [Desulforudis sp.]
MTEYLSKLRAVSPGAHMALVSSRSNFNYEPMAHFVAGGLAAGERCLVLTTDSRFFERFPRRFQEVRESGILKLEPLYQYVADEQFSFAAAEEFYMRDGMFRDDRVLNRWRSLAEEALTRGYRGLRVVGETGWLRRCVNTRDFLRYEREVAGLLRERGIAALCIYHAEDLKPEDLEDVVQVHELSLFQTRDGLVTPPSGGGYLPLLHGNLIDAVRLIEVNRQITFLGQLSRAISYKREPSEIALTSIHMLVRYLDARAGFLAVIDFASGSLREAAAVGLEPAAEESIRSLSPHELGKTCYFKSTENGRPRILDRASCPSICRALFGSDGGRCLVIPIRYSREKTGAAVIICNSAATHLDNLGVDWLLSVGDTIGMAYEHQKQQIRWLHENSRAEKLRSLGILTSGIAHDFNNLLAVIVGNLQLAQEKTADPFLQANLKQAYGAARDASALVRRVQEFYRPKLAREFSPVCVSDLVRDAVVFTRNRWHNTALAEGVQIEVVQELESEAWVSGTESALREALVNILINAFDALNGRGGTVAVRTRETDAEVVISVADNGSGIPPETLPYVFDPFFTTKGERGSGLGLAIAYNITTSHGGTIEVQSAVGGSTFNVVLPVLRVETQEPPAESPEESARPVIGASVLLIDDDPAVLTTLQDLLVALGCRVKAVRGGEEALGVLTWEPFDLVFCDLAMPGLTGLEVGARIKSVYPEMPFVLVTGWVDPALDDTITDSVDLVLRKPVTLDDLRHALVTVGPAVETRTESQ